MILNGQKIPFPAIIKVSFNPLFESLKRMEEAGDDNASIYARNLLELADEYPDLKEGFEDLHLLEKYKVPINKLTSILFPEALTNNEIKAAIPPFNFTPFYFSSRFKKILEASGRDFSFELKDFNQEKLYMYGCTAILGQYYGYPIDSGVPITIEIIDRKSSVKRTYRLAFNADMIEMLPTSKAINISYEDYLELMDHFGDLDLWMKKFPPDSWVMRGIGIANLMDVTLDDSISTISSNLLIKSNGSGDRINKALRRYFSMDDLEFGFVGYENDAFFSVPKTKMHSVIITEEEKLSCRDAMCDFSYQQLIEKRQALAISDVDRFHSLSGSILSERLVSNEIKSYILAPLVHEDAFFGFVELASKKKYALNTFTLIKLEKILPMVSLAASRYKVEFENKIEAIIQQECTTIHPSVKWRFQEEAQQFLIKKLKKEEPQFSDIVFKNIYPLYGQLDIKGSSDTRNEALKKDLTRQITQVRKVLKSALKKTSMPVYEELVFRIDGLKKEIDKGLLAGSEQKIQGFLSSEVYPVFDYLIENDKELAKLISTYRSLLDPKLNTIYEERKHFDDSVAKINYTLASKLDEDQKAAQTMYPHYFERYKTDGLEYNIYIGQSISREKKFNPIYLRNMLIWQLKSMCELEREYHLLRDHLAVPLEIASLILLYSNPLSVHFRIDEKRFDVEGAYNARYEIVKKRIDKARIKSTGERITSPGKIAVIYSRDQDAMEYRKYIGFMQAKGYLKDNSLEDLEVEDLQGITGLRALRVEVNYSETTHQEKEYDLDKLIESIEKS